MDRHLRRAASLRAQGGEGLDRQFSDGLSTWSMTRKSRGPLAFLKLTPSCSLPAARSKYRQGQCCSQVKPQVPGSSDDRKIQDCAEGARKLIGACCDHIHRQIWSPRARLRPEGNRTYRCHKAALANSAPFTSERSFAQAICGCVRPPKPQSAPAITFSLPSTAANL